MGNIESCPAGFDTGNLFTCRAQCPAEFKYVQDSGPARLERCVHITRNNRSFPLPSLPAPEKDKPLPTTYAEETERVATEAARIKGLVLEDERVERGLRDVQDQKATYTRNYERIRSDYAMFSEYTQDARAIKAVADSLKPIRPPTAPASDLETERRGITTESQSNLLFVQIALALVVISLLSYLALPAEYAHGISFLLLSVGISFGFFLRR